MPGVWEGWHREVSPYPDRYSRDRSFVVLAENRLFVLAMAAGSILGSFIGGGLLGLVPGTVLLPLLAVVLALSAIKVWKHQ